MKFGDEIRKRNKEEFETPVKKEIAVLLEQGIKYKRHYKNWYGRIMFVFKKTDDSYHARKIWRNNIGACKPRDLIKYYKQIEKIIEDYER